MVFMLKTPTARQTELEMVTLESLVPADHLLRRIDAVIDFTFIRERVVPGQQPPGARSGCDVQGPVIGYLFGIRSERQQVREIEVIAGSWGRA